jgi:hypothetical protein
MASHAMVHFSNNVRSLTLFSLRLLMTQKDKTLKGGNNKCRTMKKL